MRTAIQNTSVSAYRSHVVPHFKDGQEARILDYIAAHGPSTIGEIAKALDMEKSTVSARQNALRESGQLVFGIPRKCSISRIRCKPLRFPIKQGELFS